MAIVPMDPSSMLHVAKKRLYSQNSSSVSMAAKFIKVSMAINTKTLILYLFYKHLMMQKRNCIFITQTDTEQPRSFKTGAIKLCIKNL